MFSYSIWLFAHLRFMFAYLFSFWWLLFKDVQLILRIAHVGKKTFFVLSWWSVRYIHHGQVDSLLDSTKLGAKAQAKWAHWYDFGSILIHLNRLKIQKHTSLWGLLVNGPNISTQFLLCISWTKQQWRSSRKHERVEVIGGENK